MYGYEPPDSGQQGSWREVLLMLRVAFAVILPIIGAFVGVLLLIGLTVFFLYRFPPLALIPLAVIGGGIYLLIRRDRRLQEAERRRIFGDR